jgi:hypothetical protein
MTKIYNIKSNEKSTNTNNGKNQKNIDKQVYRKCYPSKQKLYNDKTTTHIDTTTSTSPPYQMHINQPKLETSQLISKKRQDGRYERFGSSGDALSRGIETAISYRTRIIFKTERYSNFN